MNENILVFAARYAHGRNTGAPLMVVNEILHQWDKLGAGTKKQLYIESFEASYQPDMWKKVQDRFEESK